MRQIVVLRIAATRKLQDPHTRQPERIAKLFDIRRDHAEIFCPEWQITQFTFDSLKKIFSRHFNPTSILCRFFVRWHFPRCRKATKMVDPYNIDCSQSVFHTVDPPTKTILSHRIPIVDRVAPKLTGLRKIIRRNTRNYSWRTIIV
jgi:hypothetical protein